MTGPVRVASIGAGYFARFQIGAWSRLDGAEVVALADLDAARLAEAAALVPQAERFETLEQTLATKPDLVDIATPPPTHATLVRTALGRVPTVICQKPFCTGLEEARALVAEAQAAGTRLIIHENFRFQPWYRVFAALIAEGRIGTPRQLRYTLRPGDGAGPEAYLDRQPYFRDMPRFLIRETGIHLIDVFRYLLGEPQAVYADLRRENPVIAGEDAGLVIFEMANGARATLDGNRTLDHGARNTRLTMGEMGIEGTGGELRLDGSGRIRHRARGAVDWAVLDYAFEDRDFGGNCVELFQAHVLDVLDGTAAAETLAADYLRNLELEALIYESAARGQRLEVRP